MPKSNPDDRRLIEDYLPIEAISAEARREKSVRKGHISTLHLWWARRPLVASRAAVFGALAPAGSVKPEFVADLCTYPGPKDTLRQAQQVILQAHAERLSAERGHTVTVADIEAGRAPRPKVLDMFAGGGAIPLEALRLGCEAYALDLNPVAHLIQLCTLVYPQKYGQPDPAAKGSAKDGSWAGLAAEVEHWGKWVLARVKKEIGDLYPLIPDPRVDNNPQSATNNPQLTMPGAFAPTSHDNQNMLTPVAYLWTRTVRCKNPACGGIVPLARQTWLARKSGRYIALKADAETNRNRTGEEKRIRYRVVDAITEKGLGFDPTAAGSKGGNVVCPFCGTVADSKYLRFEGKSGRIGIQPMVIVTKRKVTNKKVVKVYLATDELDPRFIPDTVAIESRLERLYKETGLAVPDEPIETNPRSMDTDKYGLNYWRDLFTPRQLLTLLAMIKCVNLADKQLASLQVDVDHRKALVTYLALLVDKTAQRGNTMCGWDLTSGGGRLSGAFSRQSLPMVWDFAESNPLGGSSGDVLWALDTMTRVLDEYGSDMLPATVDRGTASQLIYSNDTFDAVVTDPPYYDSVTYSNLSDFFYVWLKRTVGNYYPEHFAANLTPKRNEAIAAFYRHGNDRKKAQAFYESALAQSLSEAHRVLRPRSPLIMIYAHKTTAGWSTLIEAMRFAKFEITEAWPLETELQGGLRLNKAMLASSIFLVARRRESDEIGAYESDVRPQLQTIVRERVETLWAKGITGADLVIACVGAGLRAFTRYASVEYANGEEVPAEKFLGEVEGAVLDTLLEKLFGVVGAGVAAVDAATRFYVLWRYAYSTAAIDAGEAIVFAYPQGVELDGAHSLSAGPLALVEKQTGKYRLRDFLERGAYDNLGQPDDNGPAAIIDVLHRLLWLMEYEPGNIAAFLNDIQPDTERLRVVAQALAGPALAGGASSKISPTGEAASLRKLTTNWRSLVEDNLFRKR